MPLTTQENIRMSPQQFYEEYGDFVLEYEPLVEAFSEVIELLPKSRGLSVAEMDSLISVIKQWRADNGYSNS